MNLSFMLKERANAGKPVRIGQIGAGKFGTMFLSQVRLTTGMHLAGLADLLPARAKERLIGVQWPAEQIDAKTVDEAIKTGKTCVTEDAMAVVRHPEIEVVIEATGDPATGIKLALEGVDAGREGGVGHRAGGGGAAEMAVVGEREQVAELLGTRQRHHRMVRSFLRE